MVTFMKNLRVKKLKDLKVKRSSLDDILVGDHWIPYHVSSIQSLQSVFAVVEVADPLFVPANRLITFKGVSCDLDITKVSFAKLAQGGFFLRDGFVTCCLCHLQNALTEVLQGLPPHHVAHCSFSTNSQPGTMHEQLWGIGQ
ncbi:hypothetical protein BsWGS_28338 [Bradybaena similaris]